MVLMPVAFASMALTVWIADDVPDWQKGEALAQMQFEYWYLQPFYPDDEIGLSSELVQQDRTVEARERDRRTRPAATTAMALPAR